MPRGKQISVDVVPRIAALASADWDRCANPDVSSANPFVSHAFLKALEDANTTGGETGWHPQHLVARDETGTIAACMPLYVKTHSQGEYVFDHAFANALHRAGGQYYPKLQAAVPFTPVPGPRILVRPGFDFALYARLLADAGTRVPVPIIGYQGAFVADLWAISRATMLPTII